VTRERWIFVAALALALAVVAALVLAPRVTESRKPQGQTAWVALQVGDEPIARVAPVEVEAGTPVTLHAVLEARQHDGSTVYFTAAPGLELEGRPVPAESVRPWEGQDLRILWFTVEAQSPYLVVDEERSGFERLGFREFYRPDWPRAWAVPAVLEPRFDDHLELGRAERARPFGVQRYHVRIELAEGEHDLVPSERYKSWGAADLPERVDSFPTVVATLSGRLARPSAVFGLAQLDPVAEVDAAAAAWLEDAAEKRLGFVAPDIWESLLPAGATFESLPWRLVRLGDQAPSWGEGVAAGDLLRVGDRRTILYRDDGDGILDGGDLVLDFARGAMVGTIDEIFGQPTLVDVAALGEP
jgi:hypothetical protein